MTVTSNLGNIITNDVGSAMFPCPKCGKDTIVRSKSERQNVLKYICPACKFEGPN